MSQKSNDKPALPHWAALLIVGIALYSFWNNAMLSGIQQRLTKPRGAMQQNYLVHHFNRLGDRLSRSVAKTEALAQWTTHNDQAMMGMTNA